MTTRGWVRGLVAGATMPVAVGALVAQAGVADAALAAKGRADVAVVVSAPRHILPGNWGWTVVHTQVSNVGTAAASGVRFSVRLPPELQVSETSTTSQWDCSNVGRTYTCAFIGDLAAGATPYGLDITASVLGATEGSSDNATAQVSTTSRETNLKNNKSKQTFDYVGKGVVKGQFWNDLNADGLREPGEPAVDPGSITIRSIDDEDQYGAANTFGGVFSEEVAAKKYYAEVEVRTSQWRFTTPDAGDDSVDSDFTQNSEDQYYRTARTEPFVVGANGTVTVDVGLVAVTPGS